MSRIASKSSCPENGNEGEDSPNQLYTLVTCVPVTTLKNLQAVNVDENQLLRVQQSYRTTTTMKKQAPNTSDIDQLRVL